MFAVFPMRAAVTKGNPAWAKKAHQPSSRRSSRSDGRALQSHLQQAAVCMFQTKLSGLARGAPGCAVLEELNWMRSFMLPAWTNIEKLQKYSTEKKRAVGNAQSCKGHFDLPKMKKKKKKIFPCQPHCFHCCVWFDFLLWKCEDCINNGKISLAM